tara:strand:+ start:2066 stop:2944 length:879 start_codon:yes stop_codon:yes gene_type:complete
MKKINYIYIFFLFLIFFSFINRKFIVKNFFTLKENLSIMYRVGGNLLKTINIEKCVVNEIFAIPPNSTLIIGHAYGNPGNNSDNIQKNIYNLISENQSNINNIIFSGDVFSKPTKKKWFNLRKKFNKEINIHIAPGNHDVGINSKNKKKIFKNSPFGRKDYPYSIFINKTHIFLEDSTSSNWLISSKTKNLINKSKSNNNILIRHNTPIRELLLSSNSFEGLKNKLPNAKKLSKSFNKPLTIISGDTGAFSFLPRITCVKHEKLKIIFNGVGNMSGDVILLLNKDSIFKYSL